MEYENDFDEGEHRSQRSSSELDWNSQGAASKHSIPHVLDSYNDHNSSSVPSGYHWANYDDRLACVRNLNMKSEE